MTNPRPARGGCSDGSGPPDADPLARTGSGHCAETGALATDTAAGTTVWEKPLLRSVSGIVPTRQALTEMVQGQRDLPWIPQKSQMAQRQSLRGPAG